MGIDLELDGAGCTYLPKLDEDLKTVIAGADLPNDLMSSDQMEILQRLGPAHNAFDTVLIYAAHFWYASNTLPCPHLISIAKCYLNCLLS